MTDTASTCARIRESRSGLPHRPLRTFVTRYVVTLVPLIVAALLLWRGALWTWIVFGLVAGFTQNAFGILTHEGAHYFFHRRKPANDLVADWCFCLAIFNSVRRYRDEHFVHHRVCCNEDDPYYGLYGPYERKRQVFAGFAQDLAGITAVRAFLRRQQFITRPVSERASFTVRLAIVQAGIAAALWTLTGAWYAYFWLWLVPLLTVPFAINRVRTFVEHHPEPGGVEANRATIPSLLEYLTMAPYGYAFHFEHHLMPDVPYYQLGWVHQELGRHGFVFGPEHLAPHGYLRTFGVLLGRLK